MKAASLFAPSRSSDLNLPMPRFVSTLLLALVVIGGAWALYHHDQIKSPTDAWNLAKAQFAGPSSSQPKVPAQAIGWSEPVRNPEVVRVGCFDLALSRSGDTRQLEIVGDLLRQFDVVTIRNLTPERAQVLAQVIQVLNQNQFIYGYSVSPGSIGNLSENLSAFVFNQTAVQLDDAFAYGVNDPQSLFATQPYVGWFRAARPRPDRAFTFTLVSVQLQEQKSEQEIAILPELFRAVRNDGRGEDDVILLGNFGQDLRLSLGYLEPSGLTPVLSDQPLAPWGSSPRCNALISPLATVEFARQSGVFDTLRKYNLTTSEAEAISTELPIWVEFSIFEGATPGRVAEDLLKSILK